MYGYEKYVTSILFISTLLVFSSINLSHAQRSNSYDWNNICDKVEIALYKSCDKYVRNNGQLTYEGERAMECIRNGLLLGGGAVALGLPLDLAIMGLDTLAGMTECDGIVKLNMMEYIDSSSISNTLNNLLR
ncbi:MAG: hypothetical protein ACPKPY_06010 [Nitrososphaeraceae archaeon]